MLCLIWVRLRIEQDETDLLVATFGSQHQGGPAVFGLSAHDGACLEQDERDLLVAFLGSVHQGGPALVVLRAHDGARLEQDESNLLVVS